ncbi:MAG: hypothetical protein FWE67_11630, partial [Planctomycetaceae bacterium]|nr:hypothetical protein [Planctomycetaceae bacterium]
DILEERMELSKDDPFCKGYIFWPETSHADILILEYFPQNAWKPDQSKPIHAVERLCRTRYRDDADTMLKIWNTFLPCSYPYTVPNAWGLGLLTYLNASQFSSTVDRTELRKTFADKLAPAPALYRALAELPFDDAKPFIKRDSIDIARTTANRLSILAAHNINVALKNWREGKAAKDDVLRAVANFRRHWELFRDLLALHDDYSMNATYERLKTVSEVNPHFEKALLNNAANGYCASYQYELFAYCYLPIVRAYAEAAAALVEAGDTAGKLDTATLQKIYTDAFADVRAKPLAEMKPALPRTAEQYRKIMLELAEVAEGLLK